MDNHASSNVNFAEALPQELFLYHIFPYLALDDFLNLRLVNKTAQKLVNSFVTSAKKKALYPYINTPERLSTLIENPTKGTGLPYVLAANKGMLNRLADSLLNHQNEAQEENALLAKIAHIEIADNSIITNDDMLPINKIVQLGQVHSLNLYRL